MVEGERSYGGPQKLPSAFPDLLLTDAFALRYVQMNRRGARRRGECTVRRGRIGQKDDIIVEVCNYPAMVAKTLGKHHEGVADAEGEDEGAKGVALFVFLNHGTTLGDDDLPVGPPRLQHHMFKRYRARLSSKAYGSGQHRKSSDNRCGDI